MKANKVLKRLAKIEELMSDVVERYSGSAPHIRTVLQDAKAAVIRAKEAVGLQSSSETTNVRKQPVTKKAAVKVRRAKAVNEHKSPVKEVAAKKTATAAQAATEAAARL